MDELSGDRDVYDGVCGDFAGDRPLSGVCRGIYKGNGRTDSYLPPWETQMCLGEDHRFLSLYPADGGHFLLFIVLCYLQGFGLDGIDASVQLNTHFVFCGVPYFLTNGGTALYCLILWFGGSLTLTALVLLLSALCRSSFITLIAALACYGIPSMLGQLGVPRELLSLNPIWDFLAEQPVMIPKLSLGGIEVSYVWVVAVFAFVMTAVAFVFGKKIFARHQVS